jgi:hypothetical protein
MSQSQQTAFQRVAAGDWNLAVSDAKRLEYLLRGPDYADIIGQVFRSVTTVTYKRERLRKDHRFFRLTATLTCSSPIPVDLFHNSAAGYRAQYYLAPGLGDSANAFAVAILSRLIVAELRTHPKRSCPPTWANASIGDSDAKVWIHQGHWLRAPDRACKQLHVVRWREQPLSTGEDRKRARYSQLTPCSEDRIDFKGGFVSRDGALFGTLKPSRAPHIHENGFT